MIQHRCQRTKTICRWALPAGLIVLFLFTCTPPIGPLLPTAAQSAVIQQGITEITNNNVAMTVLTELNGNGARYATNPSLFLYENRLINRLTTYGITVTTQTVVHANPKYSTADSLTMDNIIGELTGSDSTLAPIVVSAHWDAVPWSPGMNDNASGCAAVIEIARVINARGLQFRRTIQFIIFGLEEENLSGSYYYTMNLPPSQYPALDINMDMIGFTSPREALFPGSDVLLGFPTTGDFIGVLASNLSARQGLTFARAADTFVPELRYYFALCDNNMNNNPLYTLVMRSDHAAFWRLGIPGLMLSDTADFREGSPYHTYDDDLAHIDMNFLLAITKAVFADLCIEADVVP
jgi:hypothetical protein